MSIEQLPGARLAAETVLHRTLEEIDKIKGVMVLILYKDDTAYLDQSSLMINEVCYLLKYADQDINKRCFGGTDDN